MQQQIPRKRRRRSIIHLVAVSAMVGFISNILGIVTPIFPNFKVCKLTGTCDVTNEDSTTKPYSQKPAQNVFVYNFFNWMFIYPPAVITPPPSEVPRTPLKPDNAGEKGQPENELAESEAGTRDIGGVDNAETVIVTQAAYADRQPAAPNWTGHYKGRFTCRNSRKSWTATIYVYDREGEITGDIVLRNQRDFQQRVVLGSSDGSALKLDIAAPHNGEWNFQAPCPRIQVQLSKLDGQLKGVWNSSIQRLSGDVVLSPTDRDYNLYSSL